MKEKTKTKNRQVQRTRRALHEALLVLMREKNYEAILVQDILDRANIGRSTFYMHYRDKDELLVDGLENLRLLLETAHAQAKYSSDKKYEKVIGFSFAFFEHAQGGRALYKALSGGQGWTIIRGRIEEMLVNFMKEEARPLFKKKSSSDIPFELFIYYLGSTFMSVMTWWLNHRNPPPPKEIDGLFRDLVTPTLAANLN